jgi:hypothetical protein
MQHKKIIIGLFAATTLVSGSAASAQSNLTAQDYYISLSPIEVQAGGTIQVEIASRYPLDGSCGGQASSPGFVAPIPLDFASHTRHIGEGQVITKPGRYQATVPCTSGNSLTSFFEIVGGPSTSPPINPPTNPPTPYVKPVGPPETGGGGTS